MPTRIFSLFHIVLLFPVTLGCAEGEIGGTGAGKEALPPPDTTGERSLEDCLQERRSVRSYSSDPLSRATLGQLLWAAQGVTAPRRGFRTAPSAGATYPLETYLVIEDGVFRYVPRDHALQQVKSSDARKALARAALGQTFVAEAPASIVFTAVPERTTGRYGRRGEMYVHMEAGHAAQNIHLQAVALELGSVPVGAFDPAEVGDVIGAPENEKPLYIIPVGKPE